MLLLTILSAVRPTYPKIVADWIATYIRSVTSTLGGEHTVMTVVGSSYTVIVP